MVIVRASPEFLLVFQFLRGRKRSDDRFIFSKNRRLDVRRTGRVGSVGSFGSDAESCGDWFGGRRNYVSNRGVLSISFL